MTEQNYRRWKNSWLILKYLKSHMKKFNNVVSILLFTIFFFALSNISSQELIIGEEKVEPGIVFIFEGAIKDTV